MQTTGFTYQTTCVCCTHPNPIMLIYRTASEVDLAPEGVPTVLLDRAFDPDWNVDLEDYLALTNSAIAYLRHERFQKAVINYSALQSCLRIMVFSYTRFEDTAAHMFPLAHRLQTKMTQSS